MDSQQIAALVREALHAKVVEASGHIQSLWSGYGEIWRVRVDGKAMVAKVVNATKGDDCDIGHQRKLHSYQVEYDWYTKYARKCPCRIPKPVYLQGSPSDQAWLFVLEDLSAAGFPERRKTPSVEEIQHSLHWLATFHAHYLGREPNSLWPQGSYWRLETREKEWQSMKDLQLKSAASLIDASLSAAHYQSLIHGDAKLANICFGSGGAAAGQQVAFVDFQYVGGGIGVQDVAYLLSYCYAERDLSHHANDMLNFYWNALAQQLRQRQVSDIRIACVLSEWRYLFPLAFADYLRFLNGWAPERIGRKDSYPAQMRALALERLERLDKEKEKVPPRCTVQEPHFSNIVRGRKRVEGRVRKEPYALWKPGQVVQWTSPTGEDVWTSTVVRITEYPSFESMLHAEGLPHVLPDVMTIEDGLAIYHEFYSQVQESTSGVLALELQTPGLSQSNGY
jgi:ASC-1-like (ASCH) protein